MILDNLLMFDPPGTPRNLAQVAGTYPSGNVLDLHSSTMIPVLANLQGARDMGIGDKPALKMLVQVATAFLGGTSLQVALQGATDDGTGAPSTFNSWWLSPVYALAGLNAGSRLYNMDMPRPPDGIAVPRFLRMAYITLGTFTAGTIVAGIVLDRDDQMYQGTDNSILGGYPAGINIAN